MTRVKNMDNLNNEKGAALVLTLMIITLFLVFIMGQFYQVTNTTKQVTTMEKQIDAHLMAEMGVDYFHAFLNENYDQEDPLADFIEKNLPITKIIDEEEQHQFEISIDDQTDYDSQITYISTGDAFGEEEAIEGTITINNNDESGN